jgi:glucose/mannose transport system substrate-binding protein
MKNFWSRMRYSVATNRRAILSAGCVVALGCVAAFVASRMNPLTVSTSLVTWWTSPSERAALKELEVAFRNAGGNIDVKFIDDPLASQSLAIKQMEEGHSLGAAQFNLSKQFDQLIDDGLLRRMDGVATGDSWARVFPDFIVSAIRRNGHFYAAPIDIHIYSAIYYSTRVFRQSGITTPPQSLAELIQDLYTIKRAGFNPLAVGRQDWQIKILFDTLLVDAGGSELFISIYRDHNLTALSTPRFLGVLQLFGQLRDLVTPATAPERWDQATRLVMNNRAGVQFMGDWAEGEFLQAGLVAGRDFDCIGAFESPNVAIAGGDVFVFPISRNPQLERQQDVLAHVVTRTDVQRSFARLKGSAPLRLDIDIEGLDKCQKQSALIVRQVKAVVPYAEVFNFPEENHAIRKVLVDFWERKIDASKAKQELESAL